ncbi:hypothetical protein ISF12_10725 [Pseudomonas aeruginosa]|nr:hypothetical protein [Pseudomonas aeruginosa]
MKEHAQEIAAIAQSFRLALEELESQGVLPIVLSGFPRAACGTTSTLLGDYLNQRFGTSIMYVFAMRESKPHAWLEHEGTVIDITADQFGDRPAVYIGPIDDWYREWEVDSRTVAEHIPTAAYHDERRALERILNIAGLPSVERISRSIS